MKLITWNVRSLRRSEKKRAMRRLFSLKKCSMIFIQESKLQDVNVKTLRFLGGSDMIKGEVVGSVGASGGLISRWDENFFSLEDKIVAERYVLLVGVIKHLNFKCGFGNIYAPNDDRERQIF